MNKRYSNYTYSSRSSGQPRQSYPGNRPHGRRRRVNPLRLLLFILVLALIVIGVLILLKQCGGKDPGAQIDVEGNTAAPSQTFNVADSQPTATPTETPAPVPQLSPQSIEGTDPNEDFGFHHDVNLDGEDQDAATFKRSDPINFGLGSEYTSLEGMVTFRGNNFRDTTTYGTADVQQKKLTQKWEVKTGALAKKTGSGSWTGNGWTGQPLIVKWPEATKKIMNLNEAAKAKKDLVEVVYASMDGKVHFIDLETGDPTREDLNIGTPFKGAGSLDPRGYPIIYLGSGDGAGGEDGAPRFYVYSLVNFEKLYELGKDDSYKLRNWTAFDSAALIDAETDTLIECGESGVLYTVKLNTKYDEAAGTLTMAPDNLVKMRYTTQRSRDGESNNSYWLGMETSPVIYGKYLFTGDNGGNLMCVDLDTMNNVWNADTLDDTNGSPIFEFEEDGKGYIYISTSLHFTQDSNAHGELAIWKIDANTGEKVWTSPFECNTYPDVSGGVQATGLIGKNSLEDIVVYPIARSPNMNDGYLLALNKSDGSEAWRFKMDNYAWSSPIAIYDEAGTGYIVQCDYAGNVFLLDGKGTLLDTLNVGEVTIEATPTAYDDMIVLGTRGQQVLGIRID